jgi:Protein of unknown function (DUF3551)
MRIMLALAALAAAFFTNVPASQAYYGNAPWCAVVSIGWGDLDEACIYNTFEECRPNVIAGNRGFCSENPHYVPRAEAPVKHKKRRVRH